MSSLQNITALAPPNEEAPKNIHDITKEKLISGEYKFSCKRGRSKVWDIFGRIEDSDGEEIENVVGCRKCSNIYKFDRSTSNLVKHKCYLMAFTKKKIVGEIDVPIETKQKGAELMTEWTVTNARSCCIVDDSGFKNMAKFLVEVGAKFGENVSIDNLLPHRTTISGNISKLYDFHFKEVRNELEIYTKYGYSITSDFRTDNYLRTSYVSVTIHYIKDGDLVNRLLAVKSMKGVSCSGRKIREKINEVLNDFGCDLDKDNPTIVTDRGSNMIAAFHDLNRINCVNHLLHNVIEKTIKEVPEFLSMVQHCSKIVEYLKKSGMDSKFEIPLKSYCPTRWNTVFHMFKSIETNWVDITNILKEKNEIDWMQKISLDNLSSVVSLLGPFETATKEFEGSNYATLPQTIPHINYLKKICTTCDDSDLDIVKKSKGIFADLLDKFVLQNFSKFHKIALFLYPPTNNLTQLTEAEKKETIAGCYEIMKTFINDAPKPNNNVLQPPTQGVNAIFADYCRPCQTNNVHDNINYEIQRYKNLIIPFSTQFNVLQWWSNNKEQYPLLYKTSLRILSAPASSAASESAFATARNIINEKNCEIASNEDMRNQSIFLHSNIKNLNLNLLN